MLYNFLYADFWSLNLVYFLLQSVPIDTKPVLQGQFNFHPF